MWLKRVPMRALYSAQRAARTRMSPERRACEPSGRRARNPSTERAERDEGAAVVRKLAEVAARISLAWRATDGPLTPREELWT